MKVTQQLDSFIYSTFEQGIEDYDLPKYHSKLMFGKPMW